MAKSARVNLSFLHIIEKPLNIDNGNILMPDKMDYELKKTQIMFAADTKIVELPAGNFRLEVKRGDVWVFIDGEDRIVHEGETLTVEPSHGGIMRKLYHRGHVKYKISPLDGH